MTLRCWGITAGSAGMKAQVASLAAALGVVPEMKTVTIKKPWVGLPNMFYEGWLQSFVIPHLVEKGSDTLTPPWPDLVISCGRRGAIVTLGLRHLLHKQKAKTRFIHIQDPYVHPECFDLIVAMEHDEITASNVIKTRFALHAINSTLLDVAATRFAPQFAAYPKPYVAVLLGGSTNKYTMDEAATRQAIAALTHVLERSKGSLLITPSRRTGEKNMALLREAFTGNPRVYFYDFVGDNPYMGMLALADTIIVTNDSVNMMSEAHATGKPLYILPLPGHVGTKPVRFAERLIEEGVARPLSTPLATWSYVVDKEVERIAADIKQRLHL